MTDNAAIPPILEVRDLCVEFHGEEGVNQAVKSVNFTLKRGRTLAIVGESGSGKSVSCYSILRLIEKPGRISGGSIRYHPKDGPAVDILQLAANDEQLYQLRGGAVGMIFQEPMTAFSPVHTIGAQIIEAVLLHADVDKKAARERAIEMLRKVGIPDPGQRIEQYPHELSGGLRQRAMIAMAMVSQPEILIADEPTTALDVTIQARILELIRSLKEAMSMSVIFITHDLGVVAQVADDVVVMNNGRVVESGSVFDIFEDPRHPYTKALLASMPRVDRREQRLTGVAGISNWEAEAPDGYRFSPPEGAEATNPVHYTISEGRSVLVWKK